MTHPLEHVVDAGAITALAAVLFGVLPHATALLTFVWVCIRLYETKTIQAALRRIRVWRCG
jgi:hypothetical protein